MYPTLCEPLPPPQLFILTVSRGWRGREGVGERTGEERENVCLALVAFGFCFF